MTTPQHEVHTQPGRAAVQIFAANDRINQILIEHLDPSAWRAKPLGKPRTIAAIFTHMHNVRTKWVRLTAPQLNRTHCTPQQARAGLAESAVRCGETLAEALGGAGSRVEKFHRDGLPSKVAYGQWNWEKLWKECGAPGGLGCDPRESPKDSGKIKQR